MNFGKEVSTDLRKFLMTTPSNEMIARLDGYCEEVGVKFDLNQAVNDRNELRLIENILLNNEELLKDTVWHTPHETLYDYCCDRFGIVHKPETYKWLQQIASKIKEYENEIDRLTTMS